MILKQKSVWLPILVMVALAATTATISWHLEKSQNQQIQLETSIVAEQVGLHLEDWIADRINILDHFADIFPNQFAGKPEVFRAMAKQYHESFPGFLSLNWIEPSGRISITMPEEANDPVLDTNLHDLPDSAIGIAFRRAVAGDQSELTPIVDLFKGVPGFITFQAVRDDENRLLGVIAAEYSICTMADACLADPPLRENYRFSLAEPDGRLVYRHDDTTPRGFASEATLKPVWWPEAVRNEVSVLHTPWMLTIAPSSSSLTAIHTAVDDFVLFGGLLLSLLVGWLIRVGLVRQGKLRESKDRFRRIVEGVDAMVWEFDIDKNRFIYMSPHARTILGYSQQELYQPGFWQMHIHPDDRDSAEALSDTQITHGKSVDLEYRFLMKDDGVVWLRDISGKVIEKDGRRRQKGVMIDITKQKRLELLREGRHQVVERLAENAPLPEILTLITESTEKINPGMRCSILLLDPQTQCLRHGAAPSLPDFYNQAVDGLAIGSGVASCGAAAHDKARVIVEDVMTHPNWAPYREFAARADFRACWSEPIFSSAGEVLGTFAMYHREPKSPTAEESTLIEGYAQLAAIAIERTRHEASFQDLISGTASVTGQPFFPILVKHLAHANVVRHAIVTELVNDQFQMLAFWNDGREGEPITYAAPNTPCEKVLELGEYFCPQGVQSKFPNDPGLVELNADSYYGKTLVDGEDRKIGHICVLDDKPMLDGSRIARIVRLFAIRAATELERIQTDAIIRRQAITEHLLRNELDHRVRNNLASLNTLVDISRRSAHTPEQFTTAVKGRINTMATAHDLLSHSRGRDIGLCHLVHALTPPELQKQIRRDGKPVIIYAEKASALAMVLHELLTNSMKHGALRVPEGRVRLSWEQQDVEEIDSLRLQWQESNGPEIDPDPTPGVGTSLIEGIVRSDLQGVATLRYPRSGVDHEFTINLQSTEPPDREKGIEMGINPGKPPEKIPEKTPVEPPLIVENKPTSDPAAR